MQWRRNEFQSGGTRQALLAGSFFWSCSSTSLALPVQLVVLVVETKKRGCINQRIQHTHHLPVIFAEWCARGVTSSTYERNRALRRRLVHAAKSWIEGGWQTRFTRTLGRHDMSPVAPTPHCQGTEARAPLLQMAGHGGTVSRRTANNQTVLTITKALNAPS